MKKKNLNLVFQNETHDGQKWGKKVVVGVFEISPI
jgi:hypothetical protein